MPEYRDHPQPGPMTPERKTLIRVLQDAVWPFLAHDPANPDVFWGQMARKIEEHYAAEVARLRAQVADAWDEGWRAAGDAFFAGMAAEAAGLPMPPSGDGPPNPYRAALASGDEVSPHRHAWDDRQCQCSNPSDEGQSW